MDAQIICGCIVAVHHKPLWFKSRRWLHMNMGNAHIHVQPPSMLTAGSAVGLRKKEEKITIIP